MSSSDPLPEPSRRSSLVEEIVASFEFSDEHVRATSAHLLEQLKAGLLDDSLPYQHPSFITTIPTGSEKGRFLSVDLGGTNCRICLVDLHGDGIFSIEQQKHAVPQHVRVNERYEPLFDWIASQIGAFLGTVNSEKSHGDSTLALGFTFSFTCTQTSLAAGTLLHWDKGWDIPSALGHDPCAMLQAATDAQQLPVRVAALANDSVGSLLTRAYTSTSATSSTLACIIVGTGTNAAYVERLHSVKRQHGCVNTSWKEGVMAINTEWGCMDDDMRVLPRTRFDDMVDARSTDCGFQMLEKRVSGLYLGALLRLAVLELYQQGGVFEFHIDDESPLYQSDSIDTSLMSKLAINDDNDSEEAKITLLANTLGAVSVSAVDVYIVQAIANAIVTRAARLVGAATAAIVLQSGLLTPAAESAVIEKEQAHVATTAVKDPVPTSAPLASSTGSILRRARNFFSAPFTWCLGRNRSKTKTALLSPSPSPSSSLTPSLTPSPSQSQSSSPLAPPGPVIDIGVTGSVIEHHPTFEKEMRAALRQVQGIGEAGDARIRTGLCQDGSAVGAALMVHAAMMQDAAATGH